MVNYIVYCNEQQLALNHEQAAGGHSALPLVEKFRKCGTSPNFAREASGDHETSGFRHRNSSHGIPEAWQLCSLREVTSP
jgi:hypothetical protein